MASNSPSAVLSLLVLLQLFGIVVLGLGWLYILYCLGRAANGIDRMASVAEAWLVWQQTRDNAAAPPRPAEAVAPAPVALSESPRAEF